MKCLIVDDEPNVRKSYLMMGRWPELGIERILEASNGLAALEIVQKEQPEIIITDMKMNVMDGVTLLASLAGLSYAPQIIVISGYSSYEYMHSAIAHQVLDYVLKPVGERALNDCLQRAVQAFCSAHTENFQDLLRMFTARMGERLGPQGDSRQDLWQIGVAREFLTRWPLVRVFMPILMNFNAVCKETCRGLTDLMCIKVQHAMADALKPAFGERLLVLHIKDDAEWSFLCLIGSDSATAAESLLLEQHISRAAEALRQIGLSPIFAYSSHDYKSDDVNSACRAVRRTLLHIRLDASSALIPVVDDAEYPPACKRLALCDEPLIRALLAGDRETAFQLVDRALSDIFLHDMSIYATQTLAMELFEILARMASQHDAQTENLPPLNQIWSAIYGGLGDADTLRDLFRSYVNQACLLFSGVRQSSLLNDLLSYMDHHYAEKITLASIARHFYVSREHLSRLFRQELGKSFTDCLTSIRLQHVKDLLLLTNLPLSAIAPMTGFVDPNYLSRVFRREVGVTPLSFRLQKKGLRRATRLLRL